MISPKKNKVGWKCEKLKPFGTVFFHNLMSHDPLKLIITYSNLVKFFIYGSLRCDIRNTWYVFTDSNISCMKFSYQPICFKSPICPLVSSRASWDMPSRSWTGSRLPPCSENISNLGKKTSQIYVYFIIVLWRMQNISWTMWTIDDTN